MPKHIVTSLGKSASAVISVEEVFDDGYQPSSDEINEYAVQIGINPKTEPHLLYIAREGLMQAIPSEWQICYNDECDGYYYFNTKTKVRQWQHPLDAEYIKKVEKARKSVASGVNDLSDDVSQIDSGIRDDSDLITDISPVSTSTGTIRKDMSLQSTGRFLTPLEKRKTSSSGLLPLGPIESARNKRFEIKNFPTNNSLPSSQIGFSINRLEPLAKNLENASSTATFKGGFTLSGKGSMFLKSNTKKNETYENSNCNVDLENDSLYSNNNGKNVKSILRDSSLTDVRSRPESKLLEAEEDRKSVRFNLNETNKGDIYRSLASSDDDSSNEANDDENADWDFNNADGAETHVKEITMTFNRMALNNLKSIEERESTTHSTPKNLTTLFDQSSESGPIRPMYEDTDSESVTSIKKANNSEDKKGDKELGKNYFPKPISQSLKAFELEKQETEIMQNDNKSFARHANANSILQSQNPIDLYYDPEIDIKWQEEQNKLEKTACEKRFALEKRHEVQLKAMEKELEEKKYDRKIELESQHNVEVEKFKQQLKDEFEEKRKILNQEHRMAEDKLQENHKIILQELERDLKTEEDLTKKDHAMNLQQMKDRLAHDLDLERQRLRETGENHLYEKIRCEKRLLEDKYRCLKDKYVRLKNDVKISLERRHQKREQQSLTTGSDTERSNSNKKSNDVRSSSISIAGSVNKADIAKPLALNVQQKEMGRDKSVERDRSAHLIGERSGKKFTVAAKYLSHIQSQQCPDDTSISQSDTTISNNCHHNSRRSMSYAIFTDNGNSDTEAFQQENNNNVRETHGKQRNQKKKLFTRTKSASTSRLNFSNLRHNDSQLRPCTPVENLRRQLEKLEDLEDQFPDNSLDTTYHLRYPFKIESGGKEHALSSELEFFKHRIHLERDSVRRAKESLRTQRSNFRDRQREVKNHHKTTSRHTVDQMIQEEKELTEMEVNLHRTRALLGEKVIRLRHLERSLQRLYDNKEQPHGDPFSIDINRDDATISDMSSSHSSSGFSSTDFASDTHGHDQRKEIYQESTEIIQSLEHLNAEIHEIWDILSKQQTQGLTPPPSLIYQDIMWPTSQVSTTLLSEASNQQHCTTSINYALNQPVITLAERLDHYRLASSRIPNTVNSSAIPSQSIAANTMVSQSPLTQKYKTSLVERTKDLRNWLKQAKNEHELLTSSSQ